MKKFLAYFLIVTYLFTFSEVRQCLKLPNLVEHFISHKLRDADTSLYSFIKMHYIENHGVDSDYEQDMKLPFKTHDFSVTSTNIQFPPKKIEFSFTHNPVTIHNQHSFAYCESFYPSVFLKIWQPPKI